MRPVLRIKEVNSALAKMPDFRIVLVDECAMGGTVWSLILA